MVMSWTPQSLLVSGSGWAVRLFKGGVERGAEEVLLAVGEAVEALPEEVEVGAGGGIDALRAAEAKPDLLEPGAERGGGLGEAKGGGGGEGFEDALGGDVGRRC